MVAEHEGEQLAEVVQVLAGVVEVDDLGGFGEVGGGEVPDLIPVPRLSRRSSVPA
jgi:hypothetical protein